MVRYLHGVCARAAFPNGRTTGSGAPVHVAAGEAGGTRCRYPGPLTRHTFEGDARLVHSRQHAPRRLSGHRRMGLLPWPHDRPTNRRCRRRRVRDVALGRAAARSPNRPIRRLSALLLDGRRRNLHLAVAAFPRAVRRATQLNWEGLAAFLRLGYFLGDDTPFTAYGPCRRWQARVGERAPGSLGRQAAHRRHPRNTRSSDRRIHLAVPTSCPPPFPLEHSRHDATQWRPRLAPHPVRVAGGRCPSALHHDPALSAASCRG